MTRTRRRLANRANAAALATATATAPAPAPATTKPRVIFDFDGVLGDTLKTIAAAANEATRMDVDDATVRGFVGDGATMLLKRMLRLRTPRGEDAPDADVAAALVAFRMAYPKHAFRTSLYPGVEQGLHRLVRETQASLAVCTNKPQALAELHVRSDPVLTRFFAGRVVGEEPSLPKKPDPRHLERAAALVALDGDEARSSPLVLVGDGPNDWQARARLSSSVASRGGCVLVSYGFSPLATLHHAVATCAAPPAVSLAWADSFPGAIDRVIEMLSGSSSASASSG